MYDLLIILFALGLSSLILKKLAIFNMLSDSWLVELNFGHNSSYLIAKQLFR